MHPVILTWLKVEPGEQTPLAWSFAYFFCLLCGYYMLRPVRDEMAIEGGVQHLPWMMTGTFFTLLAATPVFGLLSSKLPRVRLLFSVYGFFVVNLLIFFAVMTAQWHPEWVARVFFVWLSVFNLFVVSVFWSFMADLFTPEQGARLFGVIAAGGSAGAIVGPVLTAAVTYLLPVATLMVWSALWLVACAACIYRLDRWSRRHLPPGAVRRDAGLGGGMWAGLRLVARSSYLLGICGYLFLLTMSATVLYLEQAAVIGREIPSPEARTRLFAGIDLAVNVLTFFTQVWVTNRLVMRFGLVAALLALPIASALGFIALGVADMLEVFLVFTVVRRIGEYALSKPAREALFTVVGREEKYKAKNFIDTAVSRGGDAVTGWMSTGIKALGASTAQVWWGLVLVMVLWAYLSVRLGRMQKELRRRLEGLA
jgi:AAA family ATP:ADP antiporter